MVSGGARGVILSGGAKRRSRRTNGAWRSFVACALAISAFGSTASAAAAAPQPLQITSILALNHFAFPGNRAPVLALSPDGAFVAYVLQETANRDASITDARDALFYARKTLWIQPTAGGAPLAGGSVAVDGFAPVWSPDGKQLAFFQGAGRQGNLVIWNAATRESHTVAGLKVQLPSAAAQWFADGKRILTTRARSAVATVAATPTPVASGAAAVTTYDSVAGPRSEDAVHRVPPDPKFAIDFVIVDLTSDMTTTLAENVVPRYFKLSPDQTKLAYTIDVGSVNGDINSRELYDVYVADVAAGSTKRVAQDILTSAAGAVEWSHDGTRLASVGGILRGDASLPKGAGWGSSRPGRVYVLDLRSSAPPRAISSQIFARTSPIRWSDGDASICGVVLGESDVYTGLACTPPSGGATKTVFAPPKADLNPGSIFVEAGSRLLTMTLADSGETQVYDIDLNAAKSKLVFRGLQTIGSLAFSRDGSRAIYFGEDVSHPQDVWTAGPNLSERRQLTNLNPQLDTASLANRTVSIVWRSRTGTALSGTILLPTNYVPGKRYPTIVDVYGGMKWGSSYRTRFGMSPFGSSAYFNTQLFATRGYAVFMPNSTLTVGDPMRGIADCVLPGIDKAVALGYADAKRIGVMGQSYGGYSTMSLIVQSTRFKAAVAMAGLVDIVSFYSTLMNGGRDWTGWAESEQGRIGGTPWQYRDRYIRNSPYYYLDRVQTPVMLEFGADDFVAKFNMPEAFVALRRLGKTAELLDYAHEDHVLVREADQIDFANRMLAWFEKYLSR